MALGHSPALGGRRWRGAGQAQAEDISGPQLRGPYTWRGGMDGELARAAGWLDRHPGRGSAQLGSYCALGNREIHWLVGVDLEPLAAHGEGMK